VSFAAFFVATQLAAAAVLIVVLATVFAARLERNAVWTSYLSTWTLSAISYSLLALAGQLTGPQPPYGLCLAQAVLIYGAPPLTAFSGFALIIQVRARISHGTVGSRADHVLSSTLTSRPQ
jgi:hypothetical protein